ncbi:hypothetical protein D3C77_106850 [compost metagenome]|uniref:FHA domain-containing protein n=1 Tax=Pseudomonas TaxID=286 RepID=UPI000685A85C|nr:MULTISPECIES: FHA domain-containing protein [Pseudomonas]MCW2271228.1 type VI secretion system protein ImpI [Pseudomonas sp. JUb96]PRA58170.1 hypothetical protein CQ065_24130 [Pseudomonas sp. MYb187]
MSRLTLTVCNPGRLQHGVKPSHQLDTRGGTIGSQGASWRLSDCDCSVQPIHCEILWTEGCFCVVDRCGQTYLNNNDLSLGTLAPVRLCDGDHLRIGGFQVQIHTLTDGTTQHLARHCVTALINEHEQVLDTFIRDLPAEVPIPVLRSAPSRVFAELSRTRTTGEGLDPLAALDALRSPARPEDYWINCTLTSVLP